MGIFDTGIFDTAIFDHGEAPVTPTRHEVELTNYEPKLWWLRKPKALPEQEAREQVAEVAEAIRTVVREQVADVQAWPAYRQPTRAEKAEVRQAIEPLVAQMPGFDWTALYRALLVQEAAQRQAELAVREAWERDEEDALILLMSTI